MLSERKGVFSENRRFSLHSKTVYKSSPLAMLKGQPLTKTTHTTFSNGSKISINFRNGDRRRRLHRLLEGPQAR